VTVLWYLTNAQPLKTYLDHWLHFDCRHSCDYRTCRSGPSSF